MHIGGIHLFLDSFLASYGPILFGLAMGMFAKYALLLQEGKELTGRIVISDILLIGFLAICAKIMTEQAKLPGNAQLFVAAIFGISSYRVARLIRERWLRRFDTLTLPMTQVVSSDPNVATLVPPSDETPGDSNVPTRVEVLDAHSTDPTELLGRELAQALKKTQVSNLPQDIRDLLEQIEKADDQNIRS